MAGETSAITLRQLGVNVDEGQVHTKLLAEGRTGSVIGRLATQDLAVFGGRNIPLGQQNFNTELAKAYITTLDQKIDVAPVNAYFAFENQNVVVHPDTGGRIIDTDAAIEMLRQANPTSKEQVVLPVKQTTATVTSALLEPLLSEVRAIAHKPLAVTAGESKTVLAPEQLVALIVPKITPDPKGTNKMTAQITFDQTKLNAIIDEVIGRAVIAPQPTVMSGTKLIRQGKSGIQTEDSHSLTRVLTALIQRQTGAAVPDEARIPLVTVSPPVVQQQATRQPTNNPRTRTGTGSVRLTFDDGPGAYTEQVLDILKRYNVHATFYVIGRNVQSYPGTMQRIKSEGHRIGNHSFSHPNLTRLSRAGVVQELSSTQAAVQRTSGVTPTGFRPPYGAHSQTVRDVAGSMGLSVDMWSVDTRDWTRPGSSVITRRVLAGTHPGAVVLMHVLSQQSVNALPSIIEGVRAQGYTLE